MKPPDTYLKLLIPVEGLGVIVREPAVSPELSPAIQYDVLKNVVTSFYLQRCGDATLITK